MGTIFNAGLNKVFHSNNMANKKRIIINVNVRSDSPLNNMLIRCMGMLYIFDLHLALCGVIHGLEYCRLVKLA